MRTFTENLALKAAYPAGSMVELKKMDYVAAPPVGTRGIVKFVDDLGTAHVKWENGSEINVVLGEDEIVRIF